MICAGIDAGSRALKVVLIEANRSVQIGSGISAEAGLQERPIREFFLDVLRAYSIRRKDVKRIVATGYGRARAGFADTTVTEISCQARGTRHVVPTAATVIDIGGQDGKVIRLNPDGSVRDFDMNERCAAGTGHFLEMVAQRLGVSLPALGTLAGTSRRPAAISSTCAVFAESEIIGLLAAGQSRGGIAAGVQRSVAARLGAMAGRRFVAPVVFTGGVALIPGMAAALRRALKTDVRVAPEPQLTCALGAALLAAERP